MSRWIALVAAFYAVLSASTPARAQEQVGSWRFDDGSGSMAVDDGPFGLHAAWPAASGPAWIAGVTGTALHFDGDDEAAIPRHDALEPATVSVAAWVRRTGSPGSYRYLFSKGASSCTRSSYGLYTGPHGGAVFYVAGDGWFTASPQAPWHAVWDGRWHRLAGVYDGRRVRLYLDGEEIGSGTPGPTQVEYDLASRAAFIGTYRGACRLGFDGDVDEVALWNGGLTPARIRADAVPPAETPASGPIGRAPGAPAPADPGFGAEPGFRTTPARCTAVTLSRRAVRAGRRSKLVVTVRRGTLRQAGARVVVRARTLRKVGRTNARGRVRFLVLPAQRDRRLEVKVATARGTACGRPVAYVEVRGGAGR